MFDETSTDATAEIDTEKVATALAQTERPAIITYWEGSVARMYVFAVGDDGALYVRWWEGTTWRWASQGKPPGVNYLNKHVSAITYTDNGTRMIYVFTLAADRLYVNYWDGHSWRWADQGRPSDIASHNHLTASVSAITYREGDHRRIYVFVPSLYGALFVNWWDGKQWRWDDHGKPPTSVYLGTPVSAHAHHDGATQRIHVFFTSIDGHLWARYWDGVNWHWSDQGTP